jgi:hypothetical protein
MAISEQSAGGKGRKNDLAKRLEALVKGRVIERVLRADGQEVVVELTDGVRLLVRAKEGLDISVT